MNFVWAGRGNEIKGNNVKGKMTVDRFVEDDKTSLTLGEHKIFANRSASPTHQRDSHSLAGLWWDAKGDWTRAHESARQDESPECSWVHACLHRKEGD